MTTYNTANLTQDQWQKMAANIGNDMRNGTPFSVSGPNADAMINAASAAGGVVDPSTGQNPVISTSQINPGIAPTRSAWDTFLDVLSAGGGASSVAGGVAQQAAGAGSTTAATAGAAGGYTTGGTAAQTGPNSTSSLGILDWVQSHMANYGLVILGALLVIGALLISQRKNIETAVTTVGKVAAVAA